MSSFMIWIWDPLWMRQLLRKMKEFRLRTGKLKADCWISGLFYCRTYFSRIKTFYRHFEIELPYLNDIKFDEEYLSSYFDLPTRGDIRKVCSISSNAFRRLFFSFQAVAVPRRKPFPLLLGILLGQLMIIIVAVL